MNSLGVSFDNFSVYATFVNPTRTVLFEYGFTINGTFESGVSENIEVRVTNDRTWRAYFQRVVLGSATVTIDQWQMEIGDGEITGPFSTGAGGSNCSSLPFLETTGASTSMTSSYLALTSRNAHQLQTSS